MNRVGQRFVLISFFCITESVLRFADLTRKEIGRLIGVKDSKNTQLVLKFVLSTFRALCGEKNIRQKAQDFDETSKEEANELLVEFYLNPGNKRQVISL